MTVLSRIVNAPPSPYALATWGAIAMVLAYGHRLRLPLAAGILPVIEVSGGVTI